MQPLISLQGVTKAYGNRTILRSISLDIEPGQVVGLIGPSGGGKSTLLRCLNGLTPFDEGEIRIDQHHLKPKGNNPADTVRQLRRYFGMIFQDFQLFPHLSALGNVIEAPMQLLGMSRGEATEAGLKLLKRVGLGERASYFPKQLSGGQKQRVAIARALAMKPSGLLCDEITSALDPELKHEVLDVLEGLKAEGMTLIMVTHEIGFARRAADQVFVLAEGEIAEHGPADRVIGDPQTPRTRQFLSNVLG